MMKDFVKGLLRDVPNYPKEGINFKDISPVLNNPSAYRYIVHKIVNEIINDEIEIVLGLESRGFIFGPMIADKLFCGFGMIRKNGKLPPPYITQKYDLEYGTDEISISSDIITPQTNVHIHDDLLATGGTMEAAIKLVEKLGAKVVSISFVIELKELNGREKLKDCKCYSFLRI